MSEYNWEVIKRCRRCLKGLTAKKVPAILVYGEKDIIEVLHDLRFENGLKMRILHERYEADKKFAWEMIPIEMGPSSDEKILVASLINVQERILRLQELGVDSARIILLNERVTIA